MTFSSSKLRSDYKSLSTLRPDVDYELMSIKEETIVVDEPFIVNLVDGTVVQHPSPRLQYSCSLQLLASIVGADYLIAPLNVTTHVGVPREMAVIEFEKGTKFEHVFLAGFKPVNPTNGQVVQYVIVPPEIGERLLLTKYHTLDCVVTPTAKTRVRKSFSMHDFEDQSDLICVKTISGQREYTLRFYNQSIEEDEMSE